MDDLSIQDDLSSTIVANTGHLHDIISRSQSNSGKTTLTCVFMATSCGRGGGGHEDGQTSAWSPSDVNICVTVISFLVRVPVLSEQITLQQPERTWTDGHTLTAMVEVGFAVTMVRRMKPTQSFYDGQLLHNGSFLHHPHHTKSQRNCHHDRETLWDGSNSQTEGHQSQTSG